MRPWAKALIIAVLGWCGSPAAGLDVVGAIEARCGLETFQPDRTAAAVKAGGLNLRDRLAATPPQRLRWMLPDFVKSTSEMRRTVVHGRPADVLYWHVSRCVHQELMTLLGSQARIDGALASEAGEEVLAGLDKYEKLLRDRRPSITEMQTCHDQRHPDRSSACWAEVAAKTVRSEVPLAAIGQFRNMMISARRHARRITLAKLSEEHLRKITSNFPAEDLLELASRKKEEEDPFNRAQRW